jgi:sulfur carrier protein ThiS
MATVKIKYRNKEYEVNAGMTVRDAIKKIGLEPEAVLAVSDGKLITDDTSLREGMQIKLVAVVSGGAWSLTPNPSPGGRGAGGEGEPRSEEKP